MTDIASADTPVAIDRVDYTRNGPDGIELRLTGRWLGGSDRSGTEPLLVVQVQGRRHRFAPARDGHALPPGAWEARFRIPPWAEPRHEGQAALWVGTSVVPLPLPGGLGVPGVPGSPGGPAGRGDGSHPAQRLPPPPALGEARAWPPEVALPPAEVRAWPSEPAPVTAEASGWPSDVAPPPPEADPARLAGVFDPTVDTGRTGPLADLLFKESVSALHAELEERSAEVARLQGALADARSELEARVSRQAALESAHGDLRGELQELMGAVAAQRDDYDRRLTEAEAEAAEAGERLAAAQAESDRLRQELSAERERLSAELEAERKRRETELEAERDRRQAEVQVERERQRGELAAQREEAQRELDAERVRVAGQLAELTAARDAAVADAADLRHRLAAAASGHQHHAAELSGLRDQLAAAQVSRDAAVREVAGLRAELERLGSELAVTREHQSAQGGDLGEAQRLLAEARSLSEQLRSQSSH